MPIRNPLIMAIFAALTLSAAPAHASKAFDACVRKLCVSADQMNCWVKAGSELCDDQGSCQDLQDHTGARVLTKAKRQWKVETQYGTGWVSERYMMVDSSFCPGL